MNDEELDTDAIDRARANRRVAETLQELEGNPLTPAEVKMFEMFERERWSHSRRRHHILTHILRGRFRE